jgi:O-antigen ligase
MSARFHTIDARPSVSDRYAALAQHRSAIAGAVALVVGCAFALAIVFTDAAPLLLAGLVAALVTLAVVVRPVSGVYLLFGGAILFEQAGIPGVDSITEQVHFFKQLDSFTPIPLRLSAADLLLLLTLGTLIARSLTGRSRLRIGPIGNAVAIYGSIFVIGTAIGISRGSWSGEAALFELRGPAQMCLLYFLATNLIRERGQVVILAWALAALVGVKALQAIVGYQQAQSLSWALEAVTGHEDVVFFDLAAALAIVMAILGIRTRLSYAIYAIQPLILVAELVTQRRVAFAALGTVALVIMLLSLASKPRRVLLLAIVGTLVTAAYLAVFWDEEGPLGQPIRTVRAVIEPTEVSARDLSSDNWREIENRNIAFTIEQVPLTGVGVGKQYLFRELPPSITYLFEFWRNVTHNAVLWLWLKAGALGGFALWYLIARVVLLGSSRYARLRDPEVRWMVTIPVALVAIQLAFSSVDMGLTQSRPMIVFGAVLGLDALLFGPALPAGTPDSPEVRA